VGFVAIDCGDDHILACLDPTIQSELPSILLNALALAGIARCATRLTRLIVGKLSPSALAHRKLDRVTQATMDGWPGKHPAAHYRSPMYPTNTVLPNALKQPYRSRRHLNQALRNSAVRRRLLRRTVVGGDWALVAVVGEMLVEVATCHVRCGRSRCT
jgi:hypothetical protein